MTPQILSPLLTLHNLTRRTAFMFAALALVVSSAQALQAVVMDRDLQTKVGYSATTPTKLNIFVATNYNGPIVLLLAREGNEKQLYTTLQDRYDGFLKNGQLSLKDDEGESVNLSKLLLPYKISLSVQSAPQNTTQAASTLAPKGIELKKP